MIPEPQLYKSWQDWATSFITQYVKNLAGSSIAELKNELNGLSTVLSMTEAPITLSETPSDIIVKSGDITDYPAPSCVVEFRVTGSLASNSTIVQGSTWAGLYYSVDGIAWTAFAAARLINPLGDVNTRAFQIKFMAIFDYATSPTDTLMHVYTEAVLGGVSNFSEIDSHIMTTPTVTTLAKTGPLLLKMTGFVTNGISFIRSAEMIRSSIK